MASTNFLKFGHGFARGQFNIEADSFACLLLTAAPNETALDTWEFRNSVTGEHVATGGYTAGGFDVTVASVVANATGDQIEVTFNNATLTNVTLAGVIGAILYKKTGAAATDRVMTFLDYEATKGVTGGNFAHMFTSPLIIKVRL